MASRIITSTGSEAMSSIQLFSGMCFTTRNGLLHTTCPGQ